MKRYISPATKWLAVITLICCAILLSDIILTFTGIANIGITIGVILMGGMLSIVFFCCFIGERSRVLTISDDMIVFPRGAMINGKTVFQKTVVKTNDIRSVEIKVWVGDGLITKDTNFYLLELKDGNSITVTLYHYGKASEKEIFETIRSLIV